MLKMLDVNHRCLPYCTPDLSEHTELMYGTEDADEDNFQEMITFWRQGELIRFVEEPNAPTMMDQTGIKPYPKAWYVSWRRIT